MAKDKTTSKVQYSDVVARLTDIVQALEGGTLSLEESLERFAEGVQLVREGEGLLADAEKRIEQLLSDDGRVAPLKLPESKDAPPAAAAAGAKSSKRPPAPSTKADAELDDVPF